jgi:hypothetical protein
VKVSTEVVQATPGPHRNYTGTACAFREHPRPGGLRKKRLAFAMNEKAPQMRG